MKEEDLKERYKLLISTIDTDDGIEYLAEYREFAFCGGSGKTIQEAVEDARNNLKIYIEELVEMGKPIPAPIEDLSYSGKFTVRLSKGLHKKVAESAEREGVSLNTFVVEAIAEKVGTAGCISVLSTLKDAVESFATAVKFSKPALQSVVNFNEQMCHMQTSQIGNFLVGIQPVS